MIGKELTVGCLPAWRNRLLSECPEETLPVPQHVFLIWSKRPIAGDRVLRHEGGREEQQADLQKETIGNERIECSPFIQLKNERHFKNPRKMLLLKSTEKASCHT